MDTLRIENFGQIKSAEITFDDLTVFVGPQASGKSVVLQLLKLAIDADAIQTEMRRYGIDWDNNVGDFLDTYFGEGMRYLWKEKSTSIHWRSQLIDLRKVAKSRKSEEEEKLFFIPAQRALTLRDGWPRPFGDYKPGDPFAVREFSEQLRVMLDWGTVGEHLFPSRHSMRKSFSTLLQRDLFSDYSLNIDKVSSQKRLVLGNNGLKTNLPFMVWSTGQREFIPLLLALYWLSPDKSTNCPSVEWVVLEELEMGLHPRAISVVLMLVFDLLARGYKVCLSTHSPQVLDALWTLKHLRETKSKPEVLLEVFDVPKSAEMLKLAKSALTKTQKVHYFDRLSGTTRDISDLDPSSENEDEADWGGLSEFSGRANQAVAFAVANSNGH